jgi:RimJ/RimL family protein N-acetyltransferase
MNKLELQPTLTGEKTTLLPLKLSDFDKVYAVASDPLIWEQHPQRDRYKSEVFKTYFDGAIESKGALLIKDKTIEEVLGCTRFYFIAQKPKLVHIGYSFFSRKCWGKSINSEVKKLMLDHIFQFVDVVAFEVGVGNLRSQIAVQRLGAKEVERYNKSYVDSSGTVISYQLSKAVWQA